MWTGRLPYGKCDIVPGELFVAVEFQHIAWLPIIPIRTWVIVDGSIQSSDDTIESFELSWAGVPIRFSFKSFAFAWVRTLLLVVITADALYGLGVVMMWAAGGTPIWETTTVIAIAMAAHLAYKATFAIA